MKDQKHTPTRIKFGYQQDSGKYLAYDENGILFCSCVSVYAKNRIEEACNNYDRLKRDNAELLEALKNALVTFKPPFNSGMRCMIEIAISNAEKGQ